MTAEFYQVDTIVAGRFNPVIITPDWLSTEGILPAAGDAEGKITIPVSAPHLALQYRVGKFRWQIDSFRLAIECLTLENTAHLAAEVLDRLKYTPVSAVGNNFRYRCDLADWSGRLPNLDGFSVDQLEGECKLEVSTWKAQISKKDMRILIQLDQTPPASLLTVSVNFHRNISMASEVVQAADAFDSDCKESEQILKTIFNVELKG